MWAGVPGHIFCLSPERILFFVAHPSPATLHSHTPQPHCTLHSFSCHLVAARLMKPFGTRRRFAALGKPSGVTMSGKGGLMLKPGSLGYESQLYLLVVFYLVRSRNCSAFTFLSVKWEIFIASSEIVWKSSDKAQQMLKNKAGEWERVCGIWGASALCTSAP